MMQIEIVSESCILIVFEKEISSTVFAKVVRNLNAIETHLNDAIVDIIPSYNSINITFNLLKTNALELQQALAKHLSDESVDNSEGEQANIIDIPVYYGTEVGLDLDEVASTCNLTTDEVISIHSNAIYDVYAIGFMPGFAYLGNIDPVLAMERKATPRTKIPGGSLGIADTQTAIYPSVSPGGWQIIGRTPIKLIDYNSDKMTRVNVGDKVKFNPISQSEYLKLGGVL